MWHCMKSSCRFPREGPEHMYVETDLKFAALNCLNLWRTNSRTGKTTITLGGGPPNKTEIASFVRYPAEARAGLPLGAQGLSQQMRFERSSLAVPPRGQLPLLRERLRPWFDSGNIRVFITDHWFALRLDFPGFLAASFLVSFFLLLVFFPFPFLKGGL